MVATRSFLTRLGLPPGDPGELPSSTHRFGDGSPWRIEIPSVEGPAPMEAVLEAASEHGVSVHRVSQGSGIMLLTDAEIRRMVELGREHRVEVCLFVGPRAAWDIGIQRATEAGRVIGGSLRGADQLAFGVEDVRRGVELGLRSVLVADIGLLWVLGRMRAEGELPADLVLKVSVSLPVANPATAAVLVGLGASTLNLPVDLTLAHIAGIRSAVACPLDLYIEGPDDHGGPVRYHEIPGIVRVAAPVHLKFTVRNAPGLYPSGKHLEATAIATARERVRRAAIALELLQRHRERHDREDSQWT